ncbi:glycosyltransferase involved in cell wall biosynthesis [Bosea sp. OAE506]|uniref:glycosyltransferase n=1 Tax=Bosea sp. OAE506 TaxID=2663870 RepID=UPI001A05C952
MSLTEMSSGSPRDLLICLSHLRWDLVVQRPHHLLNRAARDFRVVYVEEPLPGDRDDVRLRWDGEVLIATPIVADGTIDVESVVAERVRQLAAMCRSRRLVLWYYTPMALPLGTGLEPDCVVYDCMDELSMFKDPPPHLREREQELLRDCDLLFTGGESLQESKSSHRPDAHCFPSSIDAAHFQRARAADRPEPSDQADIPQPRIGYFGVLDERLDLSLLTAIARARPDWHFVMLGPVVKIDPAELPRPSNIHWLGAKAYDALPNYLGGWDAGFMPFALNDSTRFISPTKTPEFLAAGLPVVSTPVRDVVRGYGDDGLVEIADGPTEMIARLEKALSERDDPQRLRAANARIATTSWDATWAQMLRLLEQKLPAPAQTTPITAEAAHV